MEEKQRTKKKESKFSIIKLFFILLLFGFLAFVYIMNYAFQGLPSLDELENPKTQLSSNIYDCNGELLAQLFRHEKRREVELDSIPKHLIYALIATEDTKFYDHWGVNVERLFKAMFKTIFMGKKQGGSTITQQLAKNLYGFKNERESSYETLIRKIREWITAVQIEKNYTKNEILEMYFNTSYLGRSYYGVSVAAKAYFNKDVSQLNILESAMLVGLVNLPGRYDPARNYDAAIQKRNQILFNMVEEDFLDRATYEKLKIQPIVLYEYKEYEAISNTIAPHFAEHVRRFLEKEKDKYNFDPYEDGLSVYTTLDARMQRIANEAVKVHLDEFQPVVNKNWNWNNHKEILKEKLNETIISLSEYKNATSQNEKEYIYSKYYTNQSFLDSLKNEWLKVQVGFIVIDVKTGDIKAMVGGSNIRQGRGLNRTTQIVRQPGSAFKPIIYSVALDNGAQPITPILNETFTHEGWSPKNYSADEYGGYVTLREALKKSYNVVAARLIIEEHAPIWKILKLTKDLGISNDMPPYNSLSLGVGEVRPIELCAAYATFANKGIYNKPIALKRIEDKNKMEIAKYKTTTREAMSEETAYLITDLMRTVVNNGTGSRIRSFYQVKRDCAGKTGTTNDYKDAWFAGYTPEYAAVVWVGFDDTRISFGGYGQGARAALPVFGYFMKELYNKIDIPESRIPMPSNGNLAYVNYCSESVYKYGNARVYSSDCNGGSISELARVKNVPESFSSRQDSLKRIDKNSNNQNNSNEAVEIR